MSDPDSDSLQEETAVVRRPQPNHSLLQVRDTPAAESALPRSTDLTNPLHDDELGLGEFRGEFWDATPDTDVSAPHEEQNQALRPQGRRLSMTLVFVVVFSAVLLLLLGEGAAWLRQHW